MEKINLISVICTGLFTILAGIVGYFISLKNEKSLFVWNCYIKYLETVNKYHVEFLKILFDLEDLTKLPVFIMKEPSQIVEFTNKHDFYVIREDIIEMKKTMENLKIDEKNEFLNSLYKSKYIEKVNSVINYDIFTTIAMDFKLNSANYSFFVSPKVRNIGNKLYYEILDARKNEMREFDIRAYEERISLFESEIEKELTKFHIKKEKEI